MAQQDDDRGEFSSARAHNPRTAVQHRLHDGFAADRHYLAQMELKQRNARSDRVEAVLKFKHNVDASSARVAAQSAALRARKDKKNEQQAQTYLEELAQGKNPYEIARRTEVQRQAEDERSRVELNIQTREAAVLQRLAAETVVQKQREQLDANNRRFERQYQREMGRAAQEERTSAYLMSRTGKESLDPTGKQVRLYPSQEIVANGLGPRRRIIATKRRKPHHSEQEHHSTLLDRDFAQQETDDHDESLTIPLLSHVAPGFDVDSVTSDRLSNDSLKLPLIASRRQDNREENSPIQDKVVTHKSRELSVLERKQLAIARQRQKDAQFAHVSSVKGNAFPGNAFVATPSVLWFKDFDVRRASWCWFTLTNVSNTFNSFRLLPLEDAVNELFQLEYEKPGRMTAGSSCKVKMTFTAFENKNLETILSVASPTGILQVPIRCTRKKAVPSVRQREVVFPDTIAGERATVVVTLRNEGALPLEYQVRQLTSLILDLNELKPNTDHKTEVIDDEIDDKTGMSAGENGSMNPFVQEQDSDQMKEELFDDTRAQEDLDDAIQDETFDQLRLDATPRCSHVDPALSPIECEDSSDLLTLEEQEFVDRVYATTVSKAPKARDLLQFTKQGEIAPYSTSALSITFVPLTAMKIDKHPLIVHFSSADEIDLDHVSVPIYVSGLALPAPIYIASSQLYFHCCAYARLYRQKLVLFNHGKSAVKVHIQVPKPFLPYVEVSPEIGFVQGAIASQEGTLSVQVKFRPQKHWWKLMERAGMGSRTLGLVVAPIQVLVPTQVIPVLCLLVARLTATSVQLTVLSDETCTTELDFGTCCVGHGVSRDLTITNTARVAQRLGVTSVPPDVTIADVSDGRMMVLLPGEQRQLRLVYIPSCPGNLVPSTPTTTIPPQLTLWSSTFHQEYKLRCSGFGVTHDVTVAPSVLRLGATVVNQIQTGTFMMTNQSNRHVNLVELHLPLEATPFFTISPLVARLAPRATARVDIEFHPTAAIFTLPQKCFYREKAPKEAESEAQKRCLSIHSDLNGEGSTAPDDRSCHHTWTILCFQQPDNDSGGKQGGKTGPVQAIEVRTTVLMDPFLRFSTTILDFGQVAIGQTLVRNLEVEVTQSGIEKGWLRAHPMPIFGAFQLLTPFSLPEGLNKQKTRVLRIEFAPVEAFRYEELLELTAPGGIIRVQLCGIGVKPMLSLTPSDGIVEFSNVLARTRNERDLVLTNQSDLPLAFSILAFEEHDNQRADWITATGLPVVTFSPTSGVIPEKGSVAVHVVFQPEHEKPGPYLQKYRIRVPSEREHSIITISGRCWANQLYVFAPAADSSSHELETSCLLTTLQPVEDLFDFAPDRSLSQLLKGEVLDLLVSETRKPVAPLILSFKREDQMQSRQKTLLSSPTIDDGQVTKAIIIGGTMFSSGVDGGLSEVSTGAATGPVGSFELIVDNNSPHARLFTLDPTRGSIVAGQQLSIQVTYHPPTVDPTSTLAGNSPCFRNTSFERISELEIAQWVEVRVQCNLKGGPLWPTRSTTGEATVSVAGKGHPKGATAGPEKVDLRAVTVILRACLVT